MKTYAEFDKLLLVGRNHARKKIANNTYAIRSTVDTTIAIRLHQTDIITFHANGRVVLNSGGWKSSTTKDRINTFSPVRISQANSVWTFGYGSQLHTFADGVVLKPDGTVSGAAKPDQIAADVKLRKSINAFAQKVAKALPLPPPGAGDCFYCQLKEVTTGKPLGEVHNNVDHLREHMREGYLVPSLVLTAMERAGLTDFVKASAFSPSNIGRYQVPKAVRAYLLDQFGLKKQNARTSGFALR